MYKPGKSCSGAALGTTRVPPTANPTRATIPKTSV
jgi:hypothetical protein